MDPTKPLPEAEAMKKLLQGPVPFSTARRPMSATSRREIASIPGTDPEVRDRLLNQAASEEAEKLEGEIWPLTVREVWEIEAAKLDAMRQAEDLDTTARRQFVRLILPRIYAHVVLRVPATNGKVRVLSAKDAAELDQVAADAVYLAYTEAFELTRDQLPKADAPRS